MSSIYKYRRITTEGPNGAVAFVGVFEVERCAVWPFGRNPALYDQLPDTMKRGQP